jgi:hypothetical protein
LLIIENLPYEGNIKRKKEFCWISSLNFYIFVASKI